MAECLTCHHDSSLHDERDCNVSGCACDGLRLAEITPDVPPPKPGACMHIMGEGAVWVVEELAEVEERLAGSPDFVALTGCDFERGAFCMYDLRIRPEAVMSYHGFLSERWERVLEAVGR